MEAVLNAALPIFALILAGYLAARRRLLGPAATDSLNRFVVWLALPALLFQAMARADWQELDHPGFALAYGGGIVGVFALVFLMQWGKKRRLADLAIEGLDGAYANAGYMGVPLMVLSFGEAGMGPAVIGMILTACFLYGFAIVLIEFDLQQAPGLGRTLLKAGGSLARNPLLIAPFAGLGLAALGWKLPVPADNFVNLLAGAASPCALVTIGLFLAQEHGAQDIRLAGRLVALKLLVQPAITAFLAFWVFDLPPLWSHAALLMSALPTGTGPFMLAKLYDREPGVTARAILISTLGSVFTVSLLVAWFGKL